MDGTRVIEEYFSSGRIIADPELAAIEAALFAEDAFGLRVPDELMTHERLGSPEAMAALVESLRGGAR